MKGDQKPSVLLNFWSREKLIISSCWKFLFGFPRDAISKFNSFAIHPQFREFTRPKIKREKYLNCNNFGITDKLERRKIGGWSRVMWWAEWVMGKVRWWLNGWWDPVADGKCGLESNSKANTHRFSAHRGWGIDSLRIDWPARDEIDEAAPVARGARREGRGHHLVA